MRAGVSTASDLALLDGSERKLGQESETSVARTRGLGATPPEILHVRLRAAGKAFHITILFIEIMQHIKHQSLRCPEDVTKTDAFDLEAAEALPL